jgi:hypothetical protein
MSKDDGGMSLRDYFAAHSIDAAVRILHTGGRYTEATINDAAAVAYALADAMLEAREKNK